MKPGVIQLQTRTLFVLLLAGGLLFSLLGSMLVGELRAQDGDQVIHACSDRNNLRIVDDPGECRGNEQHVTWNQQGPQGADGAPGPPGDVGEVVVNVPGDSETSQPLDGYILFGEDLGAKQSRIYSVDHGVDNPSTIGAGGGAGKATFSPIRVVMELNESAPEAFLTLAQGKHLSSAEIHIESDGDVKWSYLLEDALITHHALGDPVGGASQTPTLVLELDFHKIKMIYTDDGGNEHSGGWDVQGNVVWN